MLLEVFNLFTGKWLTFLNTIQQDDVVKRKFWHFSQLPGVAQIKHAPGNGNLHRALLQLVFR